jgi:hypothetical protein
MQNIILFLLLSMSSVTWAVPSELLNSNESGKPGFIQKARGSYPGWATQDQIRSLAGTLTEIVHGHHVRPLAAVQQTQEEGLQNRVASLPMTNFTSFRNAYMGISVGMLFNRPPA